VNGRVLAVVRSLGFHSVRWSIDTLDSMEPRKRPAYIANRVLGRSDADLRGAIVLMHVGYPETVEALPTIIRGLRHRGFELIELSSWIPQQAPVAVSPRSDPSSDLLRATPAR
jgi:peptidoglycan/xylan/chitin deacetylase (PgdA/CDA1 family)